MLCHNAKMCAHLIHLPECRRSHPPMEPRAHKEDIEGKVNLKEGPL